ncbi:MAG TPA: tRNA pseudouridine(38-40) synthase TruA [Acidiphilium sp.]|nr:MAG: tRNA pseudouridine(38-40) synthase TruA [Acidiphilium sp. 21-60-14]OYV91100.1 MAG: tRNA pseudouridine(38-40) synthase TruA [Acidiphilium sp. 37-60-79]OZB39992.1 MAG: tRNA pseudouridine(38-40) synthase TruA [Acidiphilium sp. 34-60-192]HQT86962.1 tRNA pseudouridine(38-40) synthase TruA [Acidiphilium sp.]HQU22991.1 tRNA pseudouridine(38-40) synthase TruA [Acidiphilium sp.]
MNRFALKLEYDGTPFVGWQRQTNGPSIQQCLEQAATPLNNNIEPTIAAAGRTDAGVHATGQVALLTLPHAPPDRFTSRTIRDALNYHLHPHPIAVLEAAAITDPDWHPRFSAIARHYRYIILNRPARPALEATRVWHVKPPLDATLMHQAAQSLLGKHDFTSFRATACQANSPLRTLDRFTITRHGDHIIATIAARSFLHHQVRNMIGTLKLIGDFSIPPDSLPKILAQKSRAAAGPTAPAAGLLLAAVDFGADPFAPP